MLNLRKIAVTGSIASGKSSVCQIFKDLGAFVVSTDAIVHELLESDLQKQILHTLGIELNSDQRSLRKLIAEKVFKDPKALASLEKILHPVVLKKIEELYSRECSLIRTLPKNSQKGMSPLFVVEIPLLFEIQAQEFYDVIITVVSEKKTSLKRFTQLGFSENEYEQRMKRQIPPEQKALLSHYTIYNNGSLEDLKKQVILINQTLRNYESRSTD